MSQLLGDTSRHWLESCGVKGLGHHINRGGGLADLDTRLPPAIAEV